MKSTGKKNSGMRKNSATTRKRGDYVRILEKTHQELELQNQSLRQTQFELEVSRDHYAEFFDTAPVCFVTLTQSGIIREINLPGIRLLSPRHDHLTGWPFINFIARAGSKSIHGASGRGAAKTLISTRPISVELQLRAAGRVRTRFLLNWSAFRALKRDSETRGAEKRFPRYHGIQANAGCASLAGGDCGVI